MQGAFFSLLRQVPHPLHTRTHAPALLADWRLHASSTAACLPQMLVRKQVHLESQQHKLAQWAMELQRRENELQVGVQQAGVVLPRLRGALVALLLPAC